MPDVIMNMDVGRMGFSGDPVEDTPGLVWTHAKPSTLEKMEKLSKKSYDAAMERGAWKNATLAHRKKAKKISEDMTALQQQAIKEHDEYMKG